MKPLATNTIAELLAKSVLLKDISDTPRLDVEVILANILQQSRSYLFTWPEKTVTEQQLEDFAAALERRQRGEPVAHITGFREFWSMRLKVSPQTLIPRPDTEILVQQALDLGGKLEKQFHIANLKVLDLGTGTGAIALALASEHADWQITATDNYDEPLKVAEENRRSLGLNNVTLLRSNWFERVTGKYHLIVSNPPYIDSSDLFLQQGDVRFEPRSSLVAEEHGVSDIRVICEAAAAFLAPGGYLLFEHGYQQASQVQGIMSENGYTCLHTAKDLGARDRVTTGRYEI